MRKIFSVLATLICCLSVWTSVPAAQAFTLDKEDGEYSIQVELEGGSGKASVTSPTLITVKNGASFHRKAYGLYVCETSAGHRTPEVLLFFLLSAFAA